MTSAAYSTGTPINDKQLVQIFGSLRRYIYTLGLKQEEEINDKQHGTVGSSEK